MRDCLDTCYKIIKLIKFSPKRNAMLNFIKEEVGDHAPSVCTLCSIRWIACAQSTASILANYKNIQDLWDETLEGSLDSEIKARIQGVSSQMEIFQFFLVCFWLKWCSGIQITLAKLCKNPNYQVYRDTKLLC